MRAPAAPIASVPTGTPYGICAMERSESTPLSARLWTGTPRTGRVVQAANMPGRCAAPPAPPITTAKPRSLARQAYSRSRSGVRWAETTPNSVGTPKRSRTSTAVFIVSQSDQLPKTTPTRASVGSSKLGGNRDPAEFRVGVMGLVGVPVNGAPERSNKPSSRRPTPFTKRTKSALQRRFAPPLKRAIGPGGGRAVRLRTTRSLSLEK